MSLPGFIVQAQSLYFPPLTGATWETTSPAALGWHTDRIDSLYNFLDAHHSKAFLVVQDGRIVLEHYFGSFTADSVWYWASAGKSMTAFMMGIAQQEGLLALSDSTSHWLGTGWTSCPAEKEGLITVGHQLTMTTGLNDNVPDQNSTDPSSLLYRADAGTRWAYHTAPYTLLDNVLSAAAGKSYQLYFTQKIASRIGLHGLWVKSGDDHVLVSSPRDMVRFGLLVLNRGVWAGDTLLADTSYFRRMTTTSQNLNLSYGYLWWLNGKASYMLPKTQLVFPGSWAPYAPGDMIAALGKNGQYLNIVPSRRLVVVRMGDAPDSSLEVPTAFNNDIWRLLNDVMGSPAGITESASPGTFVVEQNFPNPFNPTTTIRYRLASAGHVRLQLYDVVGRLVRLVIDEEENAGEHQVVLDAGGMSSGTYFASFAFDGRQEVRVMTLIR